MPRAPTPRSERVGCPRRAAPAPACLLSREHTAWQRASARGGARFAGEAAQSRGAFFYDARSLHGRIVQQHDGSYRRCDRRRGVRLHPLPAGCPFAVWRRGGACGRGATWGRSDRRAEPSQCGAQEARKTREQGEDRRGKSRPMSAKPKARRASGLPDLGHTGTGTGTGTGAGTGAGTGTGTGTGKARVTSWSCARCKGSRQ